MKFQCILCSSLYDAEKVDLNEKIDCPNCGKSIIVPKSPFDKGRVIGNDFLIDSILGTGGMGTVYLAEQISLGKKVALKILSSKYSSDEKFRTEFKKEARAVSKITHTNLVQAYAFGEDRGDLYLAMEYVNGVTLGDRIENETRIAVDEALNIMQQVAEGLHTAWEKEELIHRDLKPDNIMLTSDGHVKLTDMGLARKAVELEKVTEVSGTPAYMNPEQFTKQAMDCRADIYSLGVCLYHTIVGKLPFNGSNVKEVARQHLQDEVEFPTKIVDIPVEVKKLIVKMMSKIKEKRYNNHEEVIRAIYTIRKKLTPNAEIPGVHTLSFNRYELKNLRPQEKSKKKVNSTKELARKKLRPLSAATEIYTHDGFDETSKSSFIRGNLISLICIFVCVILAFISFSPDKGEYTFKVEELIKSNINDEKKYQQIEQLLDEKPTNPNQYDIQAINTLLQAKVAIQDKKLRVFENFETISSYQEIIKDLRAANANLPSLEKELINLKKINKKHRENAEEKKSYLRNEIGKYKNDLEFYKANNNLVILKENDDNLDVLWNEKYTKIVLLSLARAQKLDFIETIKVMEKEASTFQGYASLDIYELIDLYKEGRKVLDLIEKNIHFITKIPIKDKFLVVENKQLFLLNGTAKTKISIDNLSIGSLKIIYNAINKTKKLPLDFDALSLINLSFQDITDKSNFYTLGQRFKNVLYKEVNSINESLQYQDLSTAKTFSKLVLKLSMSSNEYDNITKKLIEVFKNNRYKIIIFNKYLVRIEPL